MMKFSLDNSNVPVNNLQDTARTLIPYLNRLQQVMEVKNYETDESSLNLPFDENLLAEVISLKERKVNSNLKYVIDVGIGGSNLGTKAIYDATWGAFDALQPARSPKIIFCDTTDPEFIYFLNRFLDNNISTPEEIIINGISKSGTTTETVFNLEMIIKTLFKKSSEYINRLVITTDENSKMWERAHNLNIDMLSIPKIVGGRYSVFSAVGLFPLACGGVDIRTLLDGARSICKQLLQSDVLQISPLMSSVVLYLQNKQGKNIHDSFFFHPELESVGKWYRQLTGESLGKEKDLDGKEVHAGITPTISVGSTDLHSVAQLYLGGPTDKITTFIYSRKPRFDLTLTNFDLEGKNLDKEKIFIELIPSLEGKKTSEIMNAIFEGTKNTYQNHKLPFMEISLEDLSTQSLGEFLQFKMVEMMFLGKLLNINTFDQPNVEDYKIETKKILEQNIAFIE